jgi:hypothetical protein
MFSFLGAFQTTKMNPYENYLVDTLQALSEEGDAST